MENLMLLLNAFSGLDYFIQVTLFIAAVVSIALPVTIILGILGIIRTLAEGIACLLSCGRIVPLEEGRKSTGFMSPSLKLFKKKTEEKGDGK